MASGLDLEIAFIVDGLVIDLQCLQRGIFLLRVQVDPGLRRIMAGNPKPAQPVSNSRLAVSIIVRIAELQSGGIVLWKDSPRKNYCDQAAS